MAKRVKKSSRAYTTTIPVPHHFVRESATETLADIVRQLSGVKLRKPYDMAMVRKLKERLDAGEALNATLHEEATLRELRSLVHRRIVRKFPQAKA